MLCLQNKLFRQAHRKSYVAFPIFILSRFTWGKYVFNQFLLTINMWMTDTFALAVLGCFLWVWSAYCSVRVIWPPSRSWWATWLARGTRFKGEAAGYAGVFSLGLFLSIAVVGVICSLLGRMLGIFPPYGGAGGGLAGLARPRPHGRCQVPPAGQDPERIHHAGYRGLILGGSYGILSGACTFGFIAPILAIITVQQRVVEGIALILFSLWGIACPLFWRKFRGADQRLVEAKGMRLATQWGRKLAGLLVIGIGLYFAVSPFIV